MKKPSIELWERQSRISKYRFAERLRNRGGRKGAKNRYVFPGERIFVPQRIDLTKGSGRDVVKTLRALSHAVLEKRIQVLLDFSLTEAMTAAGMILMYAEIDRIVSLSDLPKPITIRDPRLRRPREVLKQIGLYEITGDSSDVVPEREDVVYWKASKGATQSGDGMAFLELVAARVNKAHADQFELAGVWRGVSEAVANTVDHAYKVARSDGFSGLDDVKWWMFTQLRDGVLTIAVCDLGCGYRSTINFTIPEQFINQLRGWFSPRNEDVFAIRTAMEYGRSGTKQTERGKGSRDALSVLQKHGQGQLRILSNSGWLHYTHNGVEEQQPTAGDLGIDMRGTIIWWSLPLKDTS